jgi:hypothetical protein
MRQEIGRAYRQIGDIYHLLAQDEQAASAYRAALAVQSKLVNEFPAVVSYRRDLAQIEAAFTSSLGDPSR